MQVDTSNLDWSQISFAKPYHGPAAHTYQELINWKSTHQDFQNGMSLNLMLVFIACFCLMFFIFGVYDLYKYYERKDRLKWEEANGSRSMEWQTSC